MSSLLKVPFFDDETFNSFLSRMARANGRRRLEGFLYDIGLNPAKLNKGALDEIEEVARMFSMPLNLLTHRAVRVAADKSLDFLGERFSPLSLQRAHFRVCPSCLAQDDKDERRMPGTRRYIRNAWTIPSVMACTRHSCELVLLQSRSTDIPDFNLALEAAGDLLRLERENGEPLPATPFERFVDDRLIGKRQHGELLDQLPLPVAIDLCELFGMAARHGRNFNLRSTGPMDLRNAASRGFDVFNSGEQGIYNLLDRLVQEKSVHSTRGGRGLYGSLYFTLDKPWRGAEYDGIRETIRKHALDTQAVLPTSRVFGKTDESDWRSVTNLHAGTGLGVSTINRLLAKHYEKPWHGGADRLVNGKAVERLLEQFRDAVYLPEVANLLGWNISECRRLAALGILKPVVPKVQGGTIPRYDRKAVIALKANLVVRSTSIDSTLVSLRQLSQTIESGRDEVLRAVFDGRLTRLSYSETPYLLESVKVHLVEIMEVLPDLGIARSSFIRRLGLPLVTLSRLIHNGIIPSFGPSNRVLKAGAIAAFNRTYVSSALLKRETGLTRGQVTRLVSVGSLTYAFPVAEVGSHIFFRRDVSNLASDNGLKALPFEKEQ
ncbi:TniQ family protein [Rhizobium mesosinicum]|uniref:TniQ family protein n=1 Tax=Rhizobium mesosinicum TaxID=335017 RepID=A0ABS7GMH2_9HYPH|nr:TniQ family protein [Rhizobium mesosinicum]MBW9051164.1 TniQ family protein [Rhizobium mesosinicum]